MKENTDNAILTPKQQLFCDEYLTDLNATRAALRAGYSVNTALNGQLMQIPKIKYYLQQRQAAVTEQAQVTQQMIVDELRKTAFSNMRNYYRSDGTMKGVHELTADESAALWCMKTTTNADGESTFIRLNNKLSALEKLARHFDFYNTEQEEKKVVYVYLDKDKLDKNDQFEDRAMEPEEYIDPFVKAKEDAERLRISNMKNVRDNLLFFHPKLDSLLPEPAELSYAIIAMALRRMPKAKEPWWVTELRYCKELDVLEGLGRESGSREDGKSESLGAGRNEESQGPHSGYLAGTEDGKSGSLGADGVGRAGVAVGVERVGLHSSALNAAPVKITKAMVREMERKNPNFVPFGKWRDKSDSRYC